VGGTYSMHLEIRIMCCLTKSARGKIMLGRLRHRRKEVNVIVVEMWCEVMH
jgi:hypothetical protein